MVWEPRVSPKGFTVSVHSPEPSPRRRLPVLSSSPRRSLAAFVLLLAFAVGLLGSATASASIATGKGVKFQAVKQGKRVAEVANFDIHVVGQGKGKAFGISFGP